MDIMRKLWVLVWAVVLGMATQIVGIVPFGIVLQINLDRFPAFPWSILVGAAILAALFAFLRGPLAPRAWRPFLRRITRMNTVRADLVPWTAFVVVSFGATVILFTLAGLMLTEMPADSYASIERVREIPLGSAIALLLAMAVATGIVEETAFRGVMQVPLEERLGPLVGILVVAIVFGLSHSRLPLAVLPIFILVACGWGVLARLTGSTVPGIIAHACVDALLFMWLLFYPDQLHAMLATDVLGDGMTRQFAIILTLFGATGALSVWGMIRLARLGRTSAS